MSIIGLVMVQIVLELDLEFKSAVERDGMFQLQLR
jgi:hypothetical protein